MRGMVRLSTGSAGVIVLGLAAAAQAATHNVTLSGTTFTPANLTITVGDTVHWEWVSGLHNVESGVGGAHDGNFRSGDVTSVVGTTFDVVFDQAFLSANPMSGNVYPYYCIQHVGFGMTGSITVQATGGGGIPTVSTWGMVAMVLAVLAAGSILFQRRRRDA